jgi:hypothetical protein
MEDTKVKSESSEIIGRSGKAPKLSRRSMLRAGATAMPVVLTLQSGEALAVTSNLIGSAPGARSFNTEGVYDGDVLCLDTTYADPLTSGKYDLGHDGATVNVIRPDVDYYPGAEGGTSGTPIGPDEFCQAGGWRKYQEAGWNDVTLPTNGIVVSSTALNSVSGRVTIAITNLT